MDTELTTEGKLTNQMFRNYRHYNQVFGDLEAGTRQRSESPYNFHWKQYKHIWEGKI